MTTSSDRNSLRDRSRLRAALAGGNIPCLVPMLYQLTGEERWLHAPFVPARTRGFEPLDSGGLPDSIQAEIRAAAESALVSWADGRDASVAVPNDEQMASLMSACLGEPVPTEFAPMLSEQLGFRPYVPPAVGSSLKKRTTDFSVIVIGAGVSGLAAAFALKKAGIPFTVLEKNAEVGGTWWENRYPGARVDIPTDLYSFSFAPKNWSEHFGQRDEISQYLIDATTRHEVRDAIQFGVEVQDARWDEASKTWTVRIKRSDGASTALTANAIITATGIHNRPKLPQLPGQGEFTGEIVHSARWPENAAIDGRRVAVLGTGASSMQIVNAIAPRVQSLLVLQRTPHWIAPNENYFKRTSEQSQFLMEHAPFYRAWHRFRLYWLYTERLYAALLVDPKWNNEGKSVSKVNEVYRDFLTKYLQHQLKDRPDLQSKSLPDYPPFGKRILLDNGWFETLKKPNVELLTDDIARLTSRGLVTSSGAERDIDTLILCTGFEQQRFLYPMEFYGRGGRLLREEWQEDDARAYLGIASPGFPNLFYLYGPNTNPPSGSYINTAEAQVRYIVELLTTMVVDNVGALECRLEPFEQYNRRLDEANGRMVYAAQNVHNYYRNARGRVVTNSPWPVLEYWRMMQQPNLHDYTAT